MALYMYGVLGGGIRGIGTGPAALREYLNIYIYIAKRIYERVPLIWYSDSGGD